jgi:hypothetical protein
MVPSLSNLKNRESIFENSQDTFHMVSQNSMAPLEPFFVVLWTIVAVPKLFKVCHTTCYNADNNCALAHPPLTK